MPDRLTANALESLRIKVKHSLTNALRDASWGKPQLMSRALEEVSAMFDSAAEPASRKSIANTLEAFRASRGLPTFLDLKYACLGITQPIGRDSWLLLEDPALFPLLLARVESQLQAASISPQAAPPSPPLPSGSALSSSSPHEPAGSPPPGAGEGQGEGGTVRLLLPPPLPVPLPQGERGPAFNGTGRVVQKGLRRFLKCYQALLSGYFAYNPYSEASTGQGRKNWKRLRAFLDDHLAEASRAEPRPRWIEVLSSHRCLLSDHVYERYGEALAQGSFHDLKAACERLLIPRSSWVWEVTVLARIKALCSFEDAAFKGYFDQGLAMVCSTTGIVLSEVMKKQCISLLASRYARCASKPGHEGLLEAAVTLIGNPWANRAAWDAYVNDEHARGMVGTWLKRRLIRDFFSIMTDEGAEDRKRLQSWLRMESRIDDLWVALGPRAFNGQGAELRGFRAMAGERILEFEHGSGPSTNALIMRIDDYVFVELSTPGHTCMVFRSSSLPFDLDRKWVYVGSKAPDQQQLFLQGQVLRQNIISAA